VTSRPPWWPAAALLALFVATVLFVIIRFWEG